MNSACVKKMFTVSAILFFLHILKNIAQGLKNTINFFFLVLYPHTHKKIDNTKQINFQEEFSEPVSQDT